MELPVLGIGKELEMGLPLVSQGVGELLSTSFKACRQVSFLLITAQITGYFCNCLYC